MDRRDFIKGSLAAALGLFGLNSSEAQQPPANLLGGKPLFERNQKIANSIKNDLNKPVIQSFFDLDIIPNFNSLVSGSIKTEYLLRIVEGDYLGCIEEVNDGPGLAYNISTLSEINWKSSKGIEFKSSHISCNLKYYYSSDAINERIGFDLWTFTSWTLEGIVNGEELVVNYKVDNRRPIEGKGHWGKKPIIVTFEQHPDYPEFAKARNTTIDGILYRTEFTVKNEHGTPRYTGFVVERK